MNDEAFRPGSFSAAIAGLLGTGLVAGGVGVLTERPAIAAPFHDAAQAVASALPRGEIVERRLAGDDAFEYLAYVPTTARRGARILVTVHGISRNARQHMRLMLPLAERYGVVLMAPRFPRARFPAYQQLKPSADGRRPDTLVRKAARELAELSGARHRRLYLFGYSGGAQFVHRFVMRRPERVAAYALGAAGWYTFPDEARGFPYGLRRERETGMGGFDADAFLQVPGLVLVGERDIQRGTALRTSSRVMAQQGTSRFERGLNWSHAMNEAAAVRALPPPIEFTPLSRSPHSFALSMRRGDMGEKVFQRLFGAPPG